MQCIHLRSCAFDLIVSECVPGLGTNAFRCVVCVCCCCVYALCNICCAVIVSVYVCVCASIVRANCNLIGAQRIMRGARGPGQFRVESSGSTAALVNRNRLGLVMDTHESRRAVQHIVCICVQNEAREPRVLWYSFVVCCGIISFLLSDTHSVTTVCAPAAVAAWWLDGAAHFPKTEKRCGFGPCRDHHSQPLPQTERDTHAVEQRESVVNQSQVRGDVFVVDD